MKNNFVVIFILYIILTIIMNQTEPIFSIVTWNCLHRYHEENYVKDSVVLTKYQDELKRISDQVALIQQIIETKSNPIICLQEVSGDLLTNLKSQFKEFNFLIHQYQRIPEKKIHDNQYGNFCYSDPSESLVIMHKLKSFESSTSIQFKARGKAMLSISFVIDEKKYTVHNVHYSFSFEGNKEIIMTFGEFDQSNKIICGDFNRKVEAFKKLLKENGLSHFSTNILNSNIEPYSIPAKKVSIDHIVGIGNILFGDSNIIDVKFSSDHNMLVSDVMTR